MAHESGNSGYSVNKGNAEANVRGTGAVPIAKDNGFRSDIAANMAAQDAAGPKAPVVWTPEQALSLLGANNGAPLGQQQLPVQQAPDLVVERSAVPQQALPPQQGLPPQQVPPVEQGIPTAPPQYTEPGPVGQEYDVFNPPNPQPTTEAPPPAQSYIPNDAQLKAEAEKAAAQRWGTAPAQAPPYTPAPHLAPPPPMAPPPPQVVPSAADQFLAQSSRVTVGTRDGNFVLPVIAIKESLYGLILFMPMKKDSMVFIPSPGAELNITYNNGATMVTKQCFFPGTYAQVEELNMVVVAAVLADGQGADHGEA